MSLLLQCCMDSSDKFQPVVCFIQCTFGVGKIYTYQAELTQAISNGPKKKKKRLAIVLSFKKSAKNPLKISICAKRKISLDTKCSGDIGVRTEYYFP